MLASRETPSALMVGARKNWANLRIELFLFFFLSPGGGEASHFQSRSPVQGVVERIKVDHKVVGRVLGARVRVAVAACPIQGGKGVRALAPPSSQALGDSAVTRPSR